MTERMDEVEARATLLEVLQQRLEEHRLAMVHEPDLVELELRPDDFVQFGNVLGWTATETSALYKRLVRGGFVRQKDGDTRVMERRDGVIDYAWVDDLTDDGMRLIGVLDPAEELAEALVAAIQDIKDSDDIPEAKKRTLLDWLDRGIAIARTAEGATRMAQAIAQHLS